ncbi:DUF459 domain-containing protein [Daeguia caeni]|uniref:DUF459 domain-containing protein n=1 Tax=Daeguia caeni TaxID=439612 RepID=A0ABV9H7U4_9HYPH
MRREPFATAMIRLGSTLAVAAALIMTDISAAMAQQGPRTLFELLFGPRQNTVQPKAPNPAPRRRTTPAKPKRTVQPARPPQPVIREPAVVTVEKKPDAKKILVIGDFIANGLAEGLTIAFATNADLMVASKTNGSSGFVRSDHFDWPANIGQIIDQEKPAVLVVMLGSNDRQAIHTGGTSLPARSPQWMEAYQQRVEAFGNAIAKRNIPVIWVGQLPFRQRAMMQDMLALNETYKKAAEKLGGTFVDVWDGFVDEDGNFTQTGFDVNGQTARLRANDGINLTTAGKRKLAFYVEKPLQALFGNHDNNVQDRDAGLPAETEAEKEPDRLKPIDRLQPVSLRELNRDTSGVLLGGQVIPPAGTKAHINAKTVPGRADNFAWPRQ